MPIKNEDEDDLVYDVKMVELVDSPTVLQSIVVVAVAIVAFP